MLDIHKAIEEGRNNSVQSPLTGVATVCCLSDVMSAGGMLSSFDEIATFTLGSPYQALSVEEGKEGQLRMYKSAKLNLSYNALKLNEVSSNIVLETFKKFMENPEFLLE